MHMQGSFFSSTNTANSSGLQQGILNDWPELEQVIRMNQENSKILLLDSKTKITKRCRSSNCVSIKAQQCRLGMTYVFHLDQLLVCYRSKRLEFENTSDRMQSNISESQLRKLAPFGLIAILN